MESDGMSPAAKANSIASYKIDHLLGMQVGTATLLRELARGGMAIVFIAFQRTLKRQIAVKILPKQFITDKSAAMFQQEAETSAILSHPNIITVYEVGDTDEFLFIAMQLIHGRTLADYIEAARKNPIPSRRSIPLANALRVTGHVLDALHYAHQQGIVHRDIKPANILVENHSKRPIITDFGIAKMLEEDAAASRTVHGTPLFMAPEQILGKELDGRADMYAVGVMLFQMLVPQLPLPKFAGKADLLKHKVLNKNGLFLKWPSEMNIGSPPELDRILQQALATDPQKRFPDCRHFHDALVDLRRQQGL
jgi:serine/threonine-protein kinase